MLDTDAGDSSGGQATMPYNRDAEQALVGSALACPGGDDLAVQCHMEAGGFSMDGLDGASL
eukprot:1217994-Alexandrium_andersonii.AAC.1